MPKVMIGATEKPRKTLRFDSLFKISVYFIYRLTDGEEAGQRREYGLHSVISVDSLKDAKLAAIKWLLNRCENLKGSFAGAFPACIKVHAWEPGYFEDGKVQPERIVPFHVYEWKYDRGTTLEEEIKEIQND